MAMPDRPVRTRFAPSPTGAVHLGSLRTALFAWLCARNAAGSFVLRIEDTDSKRFDPLSAASIEEALRWLGLEWDEGPDIGGPFGPYTQSMRGPIYREHAEMLISAGHAYRCFCTPERLQELREAQKSAKKQPKYDGACRQLSAKESSSRRDSGKPFTVRLRLPEQREVTFHDIVRGDITVSTSTLQDAVLLKSDGMAVYHLAVVVDDYCMKISHVIRGEEWISSGPYHVLLYEAFGWEMPVWVHLPVVLNPDGKGKMSKRQLGKQSRPVMAKDFIEAGFLPDAMFNFLSLLGWTPDAAEELFERKELINRFELSKISPAAARMPYEKLDWINGEYIRKLSRREFRNASIPVLAKAFGKTEKEIEDMKGLDFVLTEIQSRVKTLAEVPNWLAWAFQAAADLVYEPLEILIGRKLDERQSVDVLRASIKLMDIANPFHPDVLSVQFGAAATSMDLKLGSLLGPVRGAISGSRVSPPLFEMMAALGREECKARAVRASDLLLESLETNT